MKHDSNTKDRFNIDWENDFSPRNIASTTDCTGMIYRPPVTEEEAENYSDIYSIRQQTDTAAQQTLTPQKQQQISSVRKGRSRG